MAENILNFLPSPERTRRMAIELSGVGPLRAGAVVLERAIKKELSTPGRGRIYSRGKTKSGKSRKPHQASAPGDPPAVDRGRLRASVGREEVLSKGKHVIRVGPNTEYAEPLEYGSFHEGHVVAPRPYMRPAWTKSRGEMGEAMKGELVRSSGKVRE